jgi:Domain of unknown function (DUF5659)
MTTKHRCIMSLRVAKDLLAKGFVLTDLQPSTKRQGKLVFIFENSEALEKALAEYSRK